MDGFLKANLDLYKKLVKKDRDNIQIVSGREREGKSTLMNANLKYLDPTYNLSRCCFDGNSFVEAIKNNTKPYQAIGWDEAQEFTSRASISKFNRNMIQALSLIGTKNLFIGICIPSFFELDRYPAIHRSNCLLRVYSVDGDRGRFQFYNEEKKKLLYIKGKKFYDYNQVKQNFSGRFTKEVFPFDKKEYDKKKMDAMESGLNFDKIKQSKWMEQRNDLIEYLYYKCKLTQKQIEEYMNGKGNPLSLHTISDMLINRRENPKNIEVGIGS